MNIEALPSRFLRLREVLEIVGLSKSAVYARIRQGSFPKSISLGGTSVAWIEAEVTDWMNARIALRGGKTRLSRAFMETPSVGDTPAPDRTIGKIPPNRSRLADRRRDAKLDALLVALREYLIDLRVGVER